MQLQTTTLGTPCARSWSETWIAAIDAKESELNHRICGARLPDATPCTNTSDHPTGRCKYHGGCDLIGAPKGNRNAVVHGLYSRRLRTCTPRCPYWQSCPCASPEIASMPPGKAPTCPYQLMEYNTVVTDALAIAETQPHPNPMGIHAAHNVAMLQVLVNTAAAHLNNTPLTGGGVSQDPGTSSREAPSFANPNATLAFIRLMREFRANLRVLHCPLSTPLFHQKNNFAPPSPEGIMRHTKRTQHDMEIDPDSLVDSQIGPQANRPHAQAYLQQAILAGSQGRDVDMAEAFDNVIQLDEPLAEAERDHVLASYRPAKQSVSKELAAHILGNLHLPPLPEDEKGEAPDSPDPWTDNPLGGYKNGPKDYLERFLAGGIPPEAFPLNTPIRAYAESVFKNPPLGAAHAPTTHEPSTKESQQMPHVLNQTRPNTSQPNRSTTSTMSTRSHLSISSITSISSTPSIKSALHSRNPSPSTPHARFLSPRADFAQFFFRNRRGQAWVPRPYQYDSLNSIAPRKVHCDGRDVGKTSEIEIVAAWASVAMPNREMLIATQCENHLFPLMDRVVRVFERSPAFKGTLVDVKRTPSWCLRFANGFVLWGRIAGPHGMNFQGLHVDWQIVDEAQEMTDAAWEEMFQALNAGGMRWVYGVPNGLRNTFHRMTTDRNAEQYNWPSRLNPEFSAEKDAELALLYGGCESPGYIHRVLGQHGSPAYAVFDLNAYLACVDDALEYFEVSLGEHDPFEAPTGVPKGIYYLGCDLGYVRDPSEFVVYRNAPPDLVNVARINLHGVNYHRQQRIVEELDRAYRFRAIGIDAGNNGSAVAHNLKNIDVEWHDKVMAFEFGGVMDVGEFPDGTPDRRPTKLFMTELLQRRMADRTIVFPQLADRETQYAGHTYSGGIRNQIVFEKGDDHIIDADRCALLAHYLDTQELGRSETVRYYPSCQVATFSTENW